MTSKLVKSAPEALEFAGRIETTFWKDLLFGWVIPLAVMVAIWMFLMRRVGGGPHRTGRGSLLHRDDARRSHDCYRSTNAGQ